jgi:hypothetical protein
VQVGEPRRGLPPRRGGVLQGDVRPAQRQNPVHQGPPRARVPRPGVRHVRPRGEGRRVGRGHQGPRRAVEV